MSPRRIHLLLFPIFLNLMGAKTERPANAVQAEIINTSYMADVTVSTYNDSLEFDCQTFFKDPCFGTLIETHNLYLPELKEWRRLIAEHANELARFLKTFPETEYFSEEAIGNAFETQFEFDERLQNMDVFKPWTNRWSGKWSNGKTQYHIWDETRAWNGQWIQPITQSEGEFADKDNLREMMLNNRVELAINGYSCENCITGWVSKRQHGRLEIPCIGYLLSDTTMIWVTQIQKPNGLFTKNTRWFFFLESIDSGSNASQYSIYGQAVVIDNGKVILKSAERGKHFGTYFSDIIWTEVF